METPIQETSTRAAVVWLNGTHALVARGHEGRSFVTEVTRDSHTETRYLLRVVRAAEGCDQVVIMGPEASRLSFEREYVALYQRPDRLVDVGSPMAFDRADLVRHLRMLEPALRD